MKILVDGRKKPCPNRECDPSTMAIDLSDLHIFQYFSGITLGFTISVTRFSATLLLLTTLRSMWILYFSSYMEQN